MKFLVNCTKADLIPKFLKFRIPNNGCFDEQSVHDFQKKLLRKELFKAKDDLKTARGKVEKSRTMLRYSVPTKCLPSIVLYTRKKIKEFREIHKHKHEKKLTSLSLEQERPLFNIRNSVICLDLDVNPPSYVLQTLSLGPRNAILDKFNPKDVLTELDILIKHCKSHNISDEVITDINIKTLSYIKKCKKQQTSRNITMTKVI